MASTSIALGADVDDARFLTTLRDALPPVFAEVRPGLVLYLAGSDGAQDDVVGNWRLSAAGLFERDRLVTDLARRGPKAVPLVVLLAGGYGPHAWSYSARYLLWLASGRPLEPIAEDELALARFRALGPALRRVEAVDDGLAFSLSEEDLGGLAPGASRPVRFLSLFSRHGVELMLERAQILSQIRTRGFRRLRLELAAADEAVTLRIVCEDRGDERLVELRAHRSRGLVPDMELVAIDWLLLQNPRESFSERRPQLPGQEHPGLGLLRDFMGWLVVVCETHGLDGIYFVSAHYHVAMQSRRLVRPIDPTDEARLRCLKAALADLPLGEATRAVGQGLVTDALGQPVAWRPVAAVLPVSERLTALVTGPAYEDAAARRVRAPRLSLRACSREGRIGIPPEGAPRMTPRLFPSCASLALICARRRHRLAVAGDGACGPGCRAAATRALRRGRPDAGRLPGPLPAALHGRLQAPRGGRRRVHPSHVPARLHGDRPGTLGADVRPLAAQLGDRRQHVVRPHAAPARERGGRPGGAPRRQQPRTGGVAGLLQCASRSATC